MFNKKQLIVMWIVGLIICIFFICTSVKIVERRSMDGLLYERAKQVNLNRIFIYPPIIIGTLLVITLMKPSRP